MSRLQFHMVSSKNCNHVARRSEPRLQLLPVMLMLLGIERTEGNQIRAAYSNMAVSRYVRPILKQTLYSI